ncbi:MAG: cupin domain-containing protein [Bdellovibrionales bacterium]|nr:cupin domain-containing protein [Bdellovibrionales bacterium]
MIINRWLAPLTPSEEQIKSLFEKDGLEYFEENFPVGTKILEHRHPFDEIRMIVRGKILYNVSGNKFILRAGDKIIVPSNTLHSTEVSEVDCFSLCSYHIH